MAVPYLIMHSKADLVTDPSTSIDWFAATTKVEDKTSYFPEEGAHCELMHGCTASATAGRQRMVEWFTESIRK